MAAKQLIKKLKLNPYLMLESEAIEDFKDIIDSNQELNDNNGIHFIHLIDIFYKLYKSFQSDCHSIFIYLLRECSSGWFGSK